MSNFENIPSRPCAILVPGACIRSNFGRDAFAFDIAAFSNTLSSRLSPIVTNLPVGVVDLIIIAVVNSLTNSAQDRKALGYLFRVSTHIHSICSNLRNRRRDLQILFYSNRHLSSLSSRHHDLLTKIHTRECQTKSWFPLFLASPLPASHMAHVSSWTSRFNSLEFSTPPHFSLAGFHIFRSFRSLRRLELFNAKFRTWIHFARFIHGLAQLTELTTKDVTWRTDDISYRNASDSSTFYNSYFAFRLWSHLEQVDMYDSITLDSETRWGISAVLVASRLREFPEIVHALHTFGQTCNIDRVRYSQDVHGAYEIIKYVYYII